MKRGDRVSPLWQHLMILSGFVVMAMVIAGKIVYIQNYHQQVLQNKGEMRYLGTLPIIAHREDIVDRHGEHLATSVPVATVIADPQHFDYAESSYTALATTLAMPVATIRHKIEQRRHKRFVYIKRHVPYNLGEQVRRLQLDGIHLQREYKRYYPLGEALATVVGLTDIDDHGIAGVEKSFNHIVQGSNGKKLVFRDRHNRAIDDAGFLQVPQPGQPLMLSIDKRLQYKTHQALKTAVLKNKAQAGVAVVLDARSGEVLAMANTPSFNPNDRRSFVSGLHRNRVVIDAFEPGSTIKPFVMAALLDRGVLSLQQSIDTSPGYYHLSAGDKNYVVRDVRNFGVLTIPEVIIKSSNVGISRLVQSLDAQQLWQTFSQLGFGQLLGLGVPGETKGRLNHYRDWHKTDQTSLSYGYSLSLSALQLACAYTVFANDGWQLRPSLIKRDPAEQVLDKQIFRADTARAVRDIMQRVVSQQGTAPQAKVAGYSMAGKTGTVYKADVHGYHQDRYLSLFAGLMPARKPRLVAVVMIDEPSAGQYYGGQVAAPVFAEIMTAAARLLHISEDEIPTVIEEEPFYTFRNR